MATTFGAPLQVASTEQILAAEEAEIEEKQIEDAPPEIEYDALASHIVNEFQKNKDAKVDSKIEDDILDSLRAYNGKYSKEDLAKIGTGSQLFMNITSTKARAAKSWIVDILQPPKGKPWSLEPTPVEDLPIEVADILKKALEADFKDDLAQQKQQGKPRAEEAQETLREAQQKKRDIEGAIKEELTIEARHQLKKMEYKIEDQLEEGGWTKALLDFVDDFVVYPTAFMKGPIVTKKKALAWNKGEAVVTDVFKQVNKRVNPLDIYPSPSATCIQEGNFCEHMRLSQADLEGLIGVKHYQEAAILKVIEESGEMNVSVPWIDTGVEEEKADEENRGGATDANDGVIHALHFWGTLTVKQMQEWDYYEKLEEIEKYKETDIISVEAILCGTHVIKCVINDDPLKRRPYYAASFMNVPGALWGKSLPKLMEPTQRMCNAAARAMSNNMGIASGPQVEIYTDRLADDGDITEMVPFKIWQVNSDKQGGGGRAVNFFTPQMYAGELLKIYNEFESKADDVTGIPKYAYGNEKTAGAAQTAQGLAMLLESTSKIIKDCIRNIDEGLLKRRVGYQFWLNMNMEDNSFDYTGDINIVTVGSSTLSIRGAEATRRNEFLQVTANPIDSGIMGVAGRSDILRVMAEDLGLDKNVIPSAYELKRNEKKNQAAQAQQQQAEMELEKMKLQSGIQATTVQIEGQKQMHQGTMQMEIAKLQKKVDLDTKKLQVQMADLQRKVREGQAKVQVSAGEEDGRNKRQTQEVALKLKKGEGI